MPQPLRTAGFTLKIVPNATLSKLVHLWRDVAKTVPFDLTGYTVFYSSAKQQLTDTTPLFPITAIISLIGLDSAGNEVAVAETDGWIQLYASSDQTALAQDIGGGADEQDYGVQVWVDLLGVDSEGNRLMLAQNDSSYVAASVTEVFV